MIRRGETQTQRTTRAVMSWARLYTAGLPDELRHDRLDEVLSDLHEQTTTDTARGASDDALARSIRGRALRGAPADLAWRRAVVRRLPARAATRVRRAILATVIAVGVGSSSALFVNATTEGSIAADAKVQTGSLNEQIYGESLFIVYIASQDADELAEDRAVLADDPSIVTRNPNWALVIPYFQDGVMPEYPNLSGLLAQLRSEQQRGAVSNSAAQRETLAAEWLTTLAVALLAGLVVAMWVEPRWPGGPGTRPTTRTR